MTRFALAGLWLALIQTSALARDVPAGPLYNQADAASKCPAVCAPPLKWNGQWRTLGAGMGSVCGCDEPPPPVVQDRLPPEGCGWLDGSDLSVPRDLDRGSSHWGTHEQLARSREAPRIPEIVEGRLDTLRTCRTPETFARAYADASLLIGYYGRRYAGWINAMDPGARHDRGRGLTAWALHRDFAPRPDSSRLIRRRLEDLRLRLAPNVYGRLYADLSVLLALASRAD